jgi:hypothetical protein
MKQGDLVQVWVPILEAQNRYHGHTAIVLGNKKYIVGKSEYIRVLCDGPRMMPFFWLREIP